MHGMNPMLLVRRTASKLAFGGHGCLVACIVCGLIVSMLVLVVWPTST